MDAHVQHAIEIGEKNAETIELIAAHCRNARVELGRGWSMVEGMTGLPISARSVACDYAAVPSGESVNLEWVATDFYRHNCVGCPDRDPRGVPNLATLVESLDTEAEASRQRAEAAEAEREVARNDRRQGRAQALQGEPGATRDLLRLIDSVDVAEPDDDAAERLLAGVRGAPEVVTPRAADVLVESATETGNGRLLACVGYLVERNLVTAERAVEVAVSVLATRSLEPEAARLLLRHRAEVTRETVERLRRVIVNLAGPPTRDERIFSGFSRTSGRAEGLWDELLVIAYQVDPAIVLATISELLQDDADYTRLRAAGAASVIVRIEPGTVPVLASELVEALRRDDAVAALHWDEASGNMISQALAAAIEVSPAAVSEVAEREAPRLDEARRDVLFGAFDHAARRHLQESPGERVIHTVFEVSLRRLGGDWGAEIAFKASDTVELVARYHGEHLEPYIAALGGALLDAVRTPEPTYHPLLDVGPELNPLGGIVAASEGMRRRAIIGRLRDALSEMAPRYPEAVLEQISGFIELPEGDAGEEAEVKEMRWQAIRTLGALGKRHELLPTVIPHLYTALVGTDVGAKGEAITAWREIEVAHRKTNLPRELGALLPALLTDPYVYVHKRALQELSRGLSIPEEVTDATLSAAANLALHYGGEGDSDVLEDALAVIVRLARRYDAGTQQALMLFALQQSVNLNPYDLRRFLESNRAQLRDFSEFPKAILQLLRAPETVHDPNTRDEMLLRELRDLRPALLAPCADEIRTTAFAWMPDAIGPALEYVEVLQRGGCWNEAASLAHELFDSLPDTPAEAGRRGLARWVVVAATIELAIATDAPFDKQLLSDWEAAEGAVAEARAAARRAWDMP